MPPQCYGHPQKRVAKSDVVGNVVGSNVGGAVGDLKGSVVGGAIGDPEGSAVGDSKGGTIGGAVGSTEGGALGRTVGSQRRRCHFWRCHTQNDIHYNWVIFWSMLNLVKRFVI